MILFLETTSGSRRYNISYLDARSYLDTFSTDITVNEQARTSRLSATVLAIPTVHETLDSNTISKESG